MGGCRCTFRSCENSTATRPGMHFFHYPIRDEARLKVWLDIAEKPEFLHLEIDKLKNKVVCEEHFEERCFMNIKHERLIKSATPSIIRIGNEMLEVTAENQPQYEILTIEPVPNGNTNQSQSEPVLLNNRKRPLVLNDYKNRSDNFVVDLNLEGLQSGDLTISFEEPPLNSNVSPPVKQKRQSSYPMVSEARKENRILNSSLHLNTKIPEPVVLNNAVSLLEGIKKSPALKYQAKVDKESSLLSKSALTVTNVQTETNLDVVEMRNPPNDTTVHTLGLGVIADTINSTINSLNVLDKASFEEKSTEHITQVGDLKRMLAVIKSKQEELSRDFKKTNENLKQISTAQTEQLKLLNARQSEPANSVPASAPIKAESTTPSVKSKFNQNKIQLFNGIKKYLNPAMVALLRMELFGTSEREYKSDEKSISVELLNLGASTYDYLRDEWRFRLPPKKNVEKWTNDNLDDDEENSDVN